MQHGQSLRKLSRSSSHRKALFRNLATSLIMYERVETTVQKAKEIRPIVERLVTLSKEDSLAKRRSAYSYLLDKAVVHKLFAVLGPRFRQRPGGYTRIVRGQRRHGDSAEMAWIEFVERGAIVPLTRGPAKKKGAGDAASKDAKAAQSADEKEASAKKKAAAPKKTKSSPASKPKKEASAKKSKKGE